MNIFLPEYPANAKAKIWLLPPARGKVGMGVVRIGVFLRTTPALALPLQGGGNYFLRLSRREQFGACQ